MRTHLLRTFYPSPAAEPDTGCAANDEEYDKPGQDKTRVVALVNRTVNATPLSREDEYALGGYAGI
jgi:hypothetical protein